MVPAPFIGGTASVIRSPTATSFACSGGARKSDTAIGILESRIRRPKLSRSGWTIATVAPRPRRSMAASGIQRTRPDSARQGAYGAGRLQRPDQWWPRRDRNKQERPRLNEAQADARAGGTPAVPNSIGLPCPYPMLENIIEDITRVSQAFRLPTGMNMRI